MFWGLIMEPQRRYSQKVKKSFHISMASLDISNSDGEPSQILCCFGGRNYLLCTLRKPDMIQCPLDLNFEEGSEISFASNGKSHVHLTGYLTEDAVDDLFDDEADLEEEEETEAEEVTTKSKKKRSSTQDLQPARKKNKLSSPDETLEEEESEDEDFVAEEQESGSEEESELDAEEDEELEDDEDEEESAEEEEVVEEAPKINGVKKDKKQKNKENKQKTIPEQKSPAKGGKRNLQHGVIIEDLKEGQGPVAKNGKFVRVYYEGRLKSNNKVFDSTKAGNGFQFRLGAQEVIKAWDIGVAGMKVGGKRKIICPPNAAYGSKGSPPIIPPNATLVFEVELKHVK